MRVMNRSECQAIFSNWQKNMVRYGLAAGLGQLYGNASGRSVLYDLGNFLFPAGQPDPDLWSAYLAEFGLADRVIISEEKAWQDFLDRQADLYPFTRYAFSDQADFDRRLLEQFVNRLSSADVIIPIDRQNYAGLGQQAWSQDLQGDFKNFDAFDQAGGFGFVIMRQDELVAAVSTGLIYQSAIEIEIATAPDRQRQGLAAILGAKMIVESLDRQVFPLWDAHNEASKKIAQKLGYTYLGAYPAYEWKENEANESTRTME